MRNSPKRRGALSRGSSVCPTDIERELLRQLCHARLTRAAWAKIQRNLRAYAWQDIEHGLVYAAIQHLGVRDSLLLREQLPAEATRMGFPDVDWQPYFSPEAKATRRPRTPQIARLMGQLLAAARPGLSRHPSVNKPS
jgi:hypothetical protein